MWFAPHHTLTGGCLAQARYLISFLAAGPISPFPLRRQILQPRNFSNILKERWKFCCGRYVRTITCLERRIRIFVIEPLWCIAHILVPSFLYAKWFKYIGWHSILVYCWLKKRCRRCSEGRRPGTTCSVTSDLLSPIWPTHLILFFY